MDIEATLAELTNLRLAEKSAISLEETESDYVLHLDMQKCAIDNQTTYVAASSSNYTVRLYSKDNLADCGSISGHSDVITGVRFSPVDRNVLYTSSLDKTVRSWDLRTPKKHVQIFEGADTACLPLASFDVSCNDRVLSAGTEAIKEDVFLLFWDRRKADLLGCYAECHMNDITQVAFHPTNPDQLATGSTDGLISVLDISQADEDDALTYTFNSESSVSRIGWCGAETDSLYCLTHIETFHMWDTVDGDPIMNLTDLREKYEDSETKIDYLVDCIEIQDQLYLVTGDASGQIHVMTVASEDQMEVVCSLSGGHRDVVRCVYWDSQKKGLITGGEDSMLCLWSAQAALQSKSQSKSNKVKAKMRKSISKKSKPY